MGLYGKYILPKLIDRTCRLGPNMKQREKVIPLASGNVLEIGIGSGLNVPLYDPNKVKNLIGIDPSEETWNENHLDLEDLAIPLEFVKAGAEDLPLDNHQFDSVVITYSLCTIPDLEATFSEIRRVLKQDGKLIFCEHGKAPDRNIQKWQNLINPIWKPFAGGCHLNRDIPHLITENGFRIEQMETMYIPGWKPASFNFWGSARIH